MRRGAPESHGLKTQEGSKDKSNKDLTLELRHASDPSADPAAVSGKVALKKPNYRAGLGKKNQQ